MQNGEYISFNQLNREKNYFKQNCLKVTTIPVEILSTKNHNLMRVFFPQEQLQEEFPNSSLFKEHWNKEFQSSVKSLRYPSR